MKIQNEIAYIDRIVNLWGYLYQGAFSKLNAWLKSSLLVFTPCIMGCYLSHLITDTQCGATQVLILGLDKSGKGTLFYNLKNEVPPPTPLVDYKQTIDFNVGNIEWNKYIMNVGDVGGLI